MTGLVLNFLRADSSGVRMRMPSGKSLNSFKLDKDFIYDDAPHTPGLDETIWAWLSDKLGWILKSAPVDFIFRHLNYVIIIAALLVVAYIIRKLKVTGVLYSREETETGRISYDGENIHEINTDRLIAEALEKKEYRTAVRYCYIKSLKLLGDSSFVELKSNKTNSQYLKELRVPEIKKPFEELTYVFEWIWYGEIPVEKTFFDEAKSHFDNFNRLVAAKR